MGVDGVLGLTLLQTRADVGALWTGLRYWISRPASRSRSVQISVDGDALELKEVSPADQERLIELWLERHGAPDSEKPTTPAAETEQAPQPALPPAAHVSAPRRGLTVIEGEPARLVIRLVITLVVLAIAITAILAKSSPEPAWGAIGAVVGYWLR
jgi:hypothetical protein